MTAKKLCMGILTCPANKQRFDRFMRIHEKTIIAKNIDYYIIQSDPNLIGSGVDYRIEGRHFYCAAEEAYEVLAHKLAIFYSYIYLKTDYDFVYKVDDGCLLYMDALPSPNYDYGGALMVPTANRCHYGKCKNPRFNRIGLDFRHNFHKLPGVDRNKLRNMTKIRYCGGGYGYGMSRKALSHIPQYLNHILSIPLSYEDVLFGQIMYLSGVSPTRQTVGRYHQV